VPDPDYRFFFKIIQTGSNPISFTENAESLNHNTRRKYDKHSEGKGSKTLIDFCAAVKPRGNVLIVTNYREHMPIKGGLGGDFSEPSDM